MNDLRTAAQAVLDRWDSPAWEWVKQGPTAALMADLRAALAQEQAEPFSPDAIAHTQTAWNMGYETGKAEGQHTERERIKAANAPEIERINAHIKAHIKALEEAVADEREACARACEEYTDNGGGNVEDHEGHGHHLAAILRARSKA